MARIATLSLPPHGGQHVEAAILTELARASCAPSSAGFVDLDTPVADAELEPFEDWDAQRGHGRGFFATDPRECATRRVDLRGPTDLDPGPLPMDEAPPDVTGSAWHLSFAD